MLSLKRVVTRFGGKKFLSSLAAESPRMTIAKNILILEELSSATTVAALESAAKSSPTVDPSNLPLEIKSLEKYLTDAPAAGLVKFTKDPNAWQNMPFQDFIAREVVREETWPFVAAGLVVFVLFSIILPWSLPAEGRKTSKYISMLEGRHGKLDNGHKEDHHH